MSALRNILRSIRGKSFEIIDLKMAFHKDANLYGHHGHLRASHVAQNLKDAQVRFVFIGLSSPPPMTPRIMEYIWEEAKAQGYIPHELTTYGHVLEATTGMNLQQCVNLPLREARDPHLGLDPDKVPLTTQQFANADAEATIAANRAARPNHPVGDGPSMELYEQLAANPSMQASAETARLLERATGPKPK